MHKPFINNALITTTASYANNNMFSMFIVRVKPTLKMIARRLAVSIGCSHAEWSIARTQECVASAFTLRKDRWGRAACSSCHKIAKANPLTTICKHFSHTYADHANIPTWCEPQSWDILHKNSKRVKHTPYLQLNTTQQSGKRLVYIRLAGLTMHVVFTRNPESVFLYTVVHQKTICARKYVEMFCLYVQLLHWTKLGHAIPKPDRKMSRKPFAIR